MTRSPATRILRAFHPRTHYHMGTAATRVALFIDIETTGLDRHTDTIIELSAIRFHYAPDTAAIYNLEPPLHALEDPGHPLAPEIAALTGLTAASLAGHRIDEAAVDAALRDVSLVIAHNARFDRPLVERRLPAFQKLPWACSMADVPWHTFGFTSLSLEYLLMKHCREYFDEAHRAQSDCYAGIHILATPTTTGERPFALLLKAASIPTVRLWAVGASYVHKDRLRTRRYRWYPGDHRRPKAWYRDLRPDAVDAECDWLHQHVYGGHRGQIAFDHFDARDRYSARA
ncbi:MAG TPA: 3'-5' exonuclease [Gemmatimonadaceae bacterium]|nr:3'-5' exonuclease [Gemmatimonadaceae bacterium]